MIRCIAYLLLIMTISSCVCNHKKLVQCDAFKEEFSVYLPYDSGQVVRFENAERRSVILKSTKPYKSKARSYMSYDRGCYESTYGSNALMRSNDIEINEYFVDFDYDWMGVRVEQMEGSFHIMPTIFGVQLPTLYGSDSVDYVTPVYEGYLSELFTTTLFERIELNGTTHEDVFLFEIDTVEYRDQFRSYRDTSIAINKPWKVFFSPKEGFLSFTDIDHADDPFYLMP